MFTDCNVLELDLRGTTNPSQYGIPPFLQQCNGWGPGAQAVDPVTDLLASLRQPVCSETPPTFPFRDTSGPRNGNRCNEINIYFARSVITSLVCRSLPTDLSPPIPTLSGDYSASRGSLTSVLTDGPTVGPMDGLRDGLREADDLLTGLDWTGSFSEPGGNTVASVAPVSSHPYDMPSDRALSLPNMEPSNSFSIEGLNLLPATSTPPAISQWSFEWVHDDLAAMPQHGTLSNPEPLQEVSRLPTVPLTRSEKKRSLHALTRSKKKRFLQAQNKAGYDPVFVQVLNKILLDVKIKSPNGLPVHVLSGVENKSRKCKHELVAPEGKAYHRLWASGLKDSFEAAVIKKDLAYQQSVLDSYLWNHPCIRRHQPDGRAYKNGGQCWWMLQTKCKATPNGLWELAPHPGRIVNDAPKVAFVNRTWQWTPEVHDNHHKIVSPMEAFTSPSLPTWLKWVDHSLEGMPRPGNIGTICITMHADFPSLPAYHTKLPPLTYDFTIDVLRPRYQHRLMCCQPIYIPDAQYRPSTFWSQFQHNSIHSIIPLTRLHFRSPVPYLQ
ncbi:hypothetical protein CALCODRAFT_509909 [Calocera cornea HHB12733]|uniref:Uncharacterized protein n=1 Tax=Calocera cornea HHB12733 TaxID=1353952 RepID=A0A165EXR8_9BASI|nr:hypothetical protein CALCODRAFT_509909 [Calocera cornea HHB12733]